MWGTKPPCVKLTGDSGNGFEAALIGDCRLFRLFAENYSHSVLGLLQHNRRQSRLSKLSGMARLVAGKRRSVTPAPVSKLPPSRTESPKSSKGKISPIEPKFSRHFKGLILI